MRRHEVMRRLPRRKAEAPDEPPVLGGGLKQSELEALGPVAPILGVVSAWRTFKRWHDIEQANVCCCAHTRKLFDELDQLEKEILDL
jgi:hypothetical protein